MFHQRTVKFKGLCFKVLRNEENLPENQRTINLVLRMRNTKRELNDIRFEFQPSKVRSNAPILLILDLNTGLC